MDLELLSAELVRKLRGPRLSQQALSRRLGFGTNVVYLWERRRRFPGAGAFLALAQLRQVPVAARLRDFLGLSGGRALQRIGKPPATPAVVALLAHCAAGRSASELAKLSGYDRNTIARWLAGASQPRLPELLRFVGVTTLRLIDFVSVFVDPSQIDATRHVHEQLAVQRELGYHSPWTHALLHALELDDYARSGREHSAWLAARLGISVEQVERDLAALERAGRIRREGAVYRPTRVLNVDTRSDFQHNLRLKAFWADVARKRLECQHRDSSSLFSYNLFALSHADLLRLRQLHVEYFERVRQLVDSAHGADRVVLVNLQLVLLDETAR